jgi:hypothetical protein
MPFLFMIRRGKEMGCAIHGHILVFASEETVPLTDDPIYKEKVLRYYKCANCSHVHEEESLTLKDEFVA